MESRLGCIYKISIGDRFLIGSSINFQKRKQYHIYLLKRNCHDNCFLQNVYNKNPNIQFEILQNNIPEEILRFVEDIWIGGKCAKQKDNRFGMNIIDGSRLVFTKEILKKKSDAQKRVMTLMPPDKKYQLFEKIKISRSKKLKSIGKAISKSKKGKNIGFENNQSFPVVQKTKTGKVIKIWPSAYHAEIFGGFNSSHIGRVCKKHKGFKSHKGFLWSFTEINAKNRANKKTK